MLGQLVVRVITPALTSEGTEEAGLIIYLHLPHSYS